MRVDIREANEAVVSAPFFESFAHNLHCFVKTFNNHFRATFNKFCCKSSASQIRAKLCESMPKGPLNKFNV